MPKSEETDKPKDLDTKAPDAAKVAREQAAEYDSIFAPTTLVLDDGEEIEVPPHPDLRMLDDEAQAAYERLQFELESYDRHPEQPIPEQKVYDKETKQVVTTLPATTREGALKTPYRKTDPTTGEAKLLDPPYVVQVAQIALGDDYAKLRAGTIKGKKGSASLVWKVWNEQGVKLAERQAADSKSAGGAVDSAPVPPADPS